MAHYEHSFIHMLHMPMLHILFYLIWMIKRAVILDDSMMRNISEIYLSIHHSYHRLGWHVWHHWLCHLSQSSPAAIRVWEKKSHPNSSAGKWTTESTHTPTPHPARSRSSESPRPSSLLSLLPSLSSHHYPTPPHPASSTTPPSIPLFPNSRHLSLLVCAACSFSATI